MVLLDQCLNPNSLQLVCEADLKPGLGLALLLLAIGALFPVNDFMPGDPDLQIFNR